MNLKMAKVNKPNASTLASVLVARSIPVMQGHGDTNFLCAWCEATLLQGMNRQEVQSLVVKCPECGRHSSA